MRFFRQSKEVRSEHSECVDGGEQFLRISVSYLSSLSSYNCVLRMLINPCLIWSESNLSVNCIFIKLKTIITSNKQFEAGIWHHEDFYCNLVNKLMTSLKTSKIKLGVLNMTIILDQPKSRRHFQRPMKYSSRKIEEFGSLTPDRRDVLQQTFFTAHKGLTPYLKSKLESFRYVKNQVDPQRSVLQQTARLPSRSNKLILQIKEDRTQRQDKEKKQHPFQLDSSFNLRQTKKQPKHTVTVRHQYVQSDERVIILDLKSNPQENFNSLFTVNPAKTSQRMRIKMPTQRAKPQKDSARNPPISRRQYRIKSNNQLQQREAKRIRPWSTTKNHESRFNNYQLDPFQRNDPELTRTN